MTRPRKALISIADTPYYHITSRCVRRAYLCGEDHYSGKSYEHRRQWIVDRIRLLSSLFAMDICAYAVMSNHYHLALKVCPEQLEDLSEDDIMDRWCALFKGPLLVQNYRNGEALKAHERAAVSEIAEVWRKRLASVSWFMRCLNQPIARQANKEDGCTGKFWESRFNSQALKSEEALLSCMAYVDLNPLRADMAETPETSDYTSIKERIHAEFDLEAAIEDQIACGDILDFQSPLKPLLHFDGNTSARRQTGIPFGFKDYLALVDWTGRLVRSDKRGHIDTSLPPILTRLRISPEEWRINTTQFEAIHRRRFNREVPRLNTA
ncbi:MAG TPA: transposase [Gammaproteobacteria bacterium]|nr:transposase [Gammaproteobacteria bacterium]